MKHRVSSVTARGLLALHGVTRAQDPTDWSGTFPLPHAVETFYREVGPVDVTIAGRGNPFFMPSLASLWRYQRGYRWNSVTSERLPDWDDDWLVIADEGADPFIFSRARGNVLQALHGTATWSPREAFDDLNEMTACLGVIGAVIARAGEDLLDEDFDIRAQHVDSMRDQLGLVLGDTRRASNVLRSLGM